MESGCYKSVIIIQSKYDYDRASPAGSGRVQEELFQGGRIGNARIEWKIFWGVIGFGVMLFIFQLSDSTFVQCIDDDVYSAGIQ